MRGRSSADEEPGERVFGACSDPPVLWAVGGAIALLRWSCQWRPSEGSVQTHSGPPAARVGSWAGYSWERGGGVLMLTSGGLAVRRKRLWSVDRRRHVPPVL